MLPARAGSSPAQGNSHDALRNRPSHGRALDIPIIGADGSGVAINLSGAGPIAALGVFVLAQVFADGIRLRDDVEATI
jgi:hypothetical protein